jgi:hypothetical protein
MTKKEMSKTCEFQELLKQFMSEEAYGACDIKLHYKQFGLRFKPKSSEAELVSRIEYFVERVNHE